MAVAEKKGTRARTETRAPAAAALRDGPLRALIRRYYGDDCKIVTVRRSSGTRSFLFIVDWTYRGRPLRTLGTLGRTRELMEHSAMDLQAPERLVFPYERLMLVSLALIEVPRSVLLLGLGGGAMCRHLQAYLPGTDLTIVERDSEIAALAREYFHIKHRIRAADAQDIVADAKREYDAVLVDLYDAGGSATLDDGFWDNCVAALKPGGCIAINWAGGWTGSGEAGTPTQRIARASPRIPGSFLVSERAQRGNVVQLAPSAEDFRLPSLRARVRDFAERHRLPREDRDVLVACDIGKRHPARRA